MRLKCHVRKNRTLCVSITYKFEINSQNINSNDFVDIWKNTCIVGETTRVGSEKHGWFGISFITY